MSEREELSNLLRDDPVCAALLFCLWHHQGGSSRIGQAIRLQLGIGADEPLSDDQLATAKAVQAALSAQPQGEPVAWRFHFPTGRRWHYTDQSEPHERSRPELEWQPLYTAPPSGVREGVALVETDLIRKAQSHMLRTKEADEVSVALTAAITRAAEQVNAEGPQNELAVVNTRRNCEAAAPSAPQSEQPHVRVPVEQLEHWAEYWNGSANEKAMSDALEHILGEVSDLLRAATGKES